MKKITILLVLLLSSFPLLSQEFRKPSEGKVLVYITRSASAGFAINFKFFDGENYLGKFNGGKYLVYECDPGEHLFWAKSENFDFVEANLESGKVYILDAVGKMGGFKAAVQLKPLEKNDEKHLGKIIKVINKNKEVQLDAVGLDENDKAEIEELITKSKEKLEEKRSKKEIKQITADMNYM